MEQKRLAADGGERYLKSKFNLVDLAGEYMKKKKMMMMLIMMDMVMINIMMNMVLSMMMHLNMKM